MTDKPIVDAAVFDLAHGLRSEGEAAMSPQLKALTQQDCELIRKNAQYLRNHAEALFKMPVGEQFIGGRDAVLHSALLQIAEVFDRIAK